MKRVTRTQRITKGSPKARDVVRSEEEKVIPDDYKAKKTVLRTYQILWYFLGFIEVVLGFRFLFRLLGANSGSGFVNLIYAVSYPFVAPFWGIFGTPSLGRSAFETSTLVAMLVWLVIVWGIVKIVQILKPVDPEDVETAVDQY